ncbi:hypothetical protein OIO90_003825 [Microbotryomycetes sp. JL221]|nr:hypothetical protein OIO90_003825 [Microbotryomycetes sp. JL221]
MNAKVDVAGDDTRSPIQRDWHSATPTFEATPAVHQQQPPLPHNSDTSAEYIRPTHNDSPPVPRVVIDAKMNPRCDKNDDRSHRWGVVPTTPDEEEAVPAYELAPSMSMSHGTSQSSEIKMAQSLNNEKGPVSESTRNLYNTRVQPHASTSTAPSSSASSDGKTNSFSRRQLPKQPSLQNLSAVEAGQLAPALQTAVSKQTLTNLNTAQYHFRLAQRHLEAAQRFAMGTAALDSDGSSPVLESPASSINRMPFPIDTDVPREEGITGSPLRSVAATAVEFSPHKRPPQSPDMSDTASIITPSEIGRRLHGPRPMTSSSVGVSRSASSLSTSVERSSSSCRRRQKLPDWPGSSSLPDYVPTTRPGQTSLATLDDKTSHSHRRHSSVSQDERMSTGHRAYRPPMSTINSAPDRIVFVTETTKVQPNTQLQAAVSLSPETLSLARPRLDRVEEWQRQANHETIDDISDVGGDDVPSDVSPFDPQIERHASADQKLSSPAVPSQASTLTPFHEEARLLRERSASEPVLEHPSTFRQWSRSAPIAIGTRTQPVQGNVLRPAMAQFGPPSVAYQQQQPASHLYGQPTSYILSPSGQPIPVYAAPPQQGSSSYQLHPSTRIVPRLAVHTQPLQFDHRMAPLGSAAPDATSSMTLTSTSPSTAVAGLKPILKRSTTTQESTTSRLGSPSLISLPRITTANVEGVDTSLADSSLSSLHMTPSPSETTPSRPASIMSTASNSTSSSLKPRATTYGSTSMLSKLSTRWRSRGGSTFNSDPVAEGSQSSSKGTVTPQFVAETSTSPSATERLLSPSPSRHIIDPFEPTIDHSRQTSKSPDHMSMTGLQLVDDAASLHVRFRSPAPPSTPSSTPPPSVVVVEKDNKSRPSRTASLFFGGKARTTLEGGSEDRPSSQSKGDVRLSVNETRNDDCDTVDEVTQRRQRQGVSMYRDKV